MDVHLRVAFPREGLNPSGEVICEEKWDGSFFPTKDRELEPELGDSGFTKIGSPVSPLDPFLLFSQQVGIQTVGL